MSIFVHMLLLLISAAWLTPAAFSAEPVRIGVLAFRPKPQTLDQWRPLAVALRRAIPGRDFTVEAFTYPELDKAVAARQLDFVLTNPGHYVLLTRRIGLTAPLATLAVDDHGAASTAFGGVIFTRAGRTDIQSLADLRAKTIAATSTESLGGFQMQAYELALNGIRLTQNSHLIITGMPHDNVVKAVLSGRAEAGFVRTGVLENMAREGMLDISRVKIINLQDTPRFPQKSSTRLYPEWPFAALPGTDENLARHVAAALFTLEEDSGTTRAMGIHGFVVPSDYTPVADLLKELRMPPFDAAPRFTLQDVWGQYRWQLIATLIASGLFLFLLFRLVLANRKLDIAHAELKESELRYRTVADFTSDWEYWIMPDGTFRYISPSCEQVSGYTSAEFYASPELLMQIIHPDDLPAFAGHTHQLSGKDMPEPIDFRIYTKGGGLRWISHVCRPVYDPDGKEIGRRASNRDITERKQMEREVHQLAFYDALTGLPNRRLLNDRLNQAIAANKRSGLNGAVMFLDLDNFKPLNDTYGHGAGDLLLREVARRLRSCVREMDTVARFGGDEFVVMLHELDADKEQSALQAGIVAEKIRASLSEPYLLSIRHDGAEETTVEHHCTASIGVVIFREHEGGQEAILKQADAAMYQAKEAGRNQARFYANRVEHPPLMVAR